MDLFLRSWAYSSCTEPGRSGNVQVLVVALLWHLPLFFIHGTTQESWGIGSFGFFGLLLITGFALLNETNKEIFAFPFSFNRGLLISAHALVAVTRQNFRSERLPRGNGQAAAASGASTPCLSGANDSEDEPRHDVA